MRRSTARFLVMSVAFAVMAAVSAPAAYTAEATRFTVKDTSPKPAECAGTREGTISPGTWLANKQCGYYLGRAMPGSSFDSHYVDGGWRRFGRSWGTNNFCAWVHAGALNVPPVEQASASCSDETRARLRHRLSFGRDYNAAPHAATGGSWVSVDPACSFYLNYLTSTEFDTGNLRDFAGTGLPGVNYRFSSKNRAMIVAHSPRLDQWGFMSRSCVTDWRDVVFNNEDD